MAEDKLLLLKAVLRELSSEENCFICMANEVSLSTEEKVGSLFQPDTLVPAQYFETFRRKSLEPEKRLMLAVLEDATACFQKYIFARDGRGKNLFHAAEKWIMEEGNDWLFSFENIWEVLEFEPQYVREGLMRWKEEKLAGRPKAKIYRFTPKVEGKNPRVEMSGSRGDRFLKAVGR